MAPKKPTDSTANSHMTRAQARKMSALNRDKGEDEPMDTSEPSPKVADPPPRYETRSSARKAQASPIKTDSMDTSEPSPTPAFHPTARPSARKTVVTSPNLSEPVRSARRRRPPARAHTQVDGADDDSDEDCPFEPDDTTYNSDGTPYYPGPAPECDSDTMVVDVNHPKNRRRHPSLPASSPAKPLHRGQRSNQATPASPTTPKAPAAPTSDVRQIVNRAQTNLPIRPAVVHLGGIVPQFTVPAVSNLPGIVPQFANPSGGNTPVNTAWPLWPGAGSTPANVYFYISIGGYQFNLPARACELSSLGSNINVRINAVLQCEDPENPGKQLHLDVMEACKDKDQASWKHLPSNAFARTFQALQGRISAVAPS